MTSPPQQMGLFERKTTKRRLLTEFDYHRVGSPRGIRWVGDELPKNNHTRTSWQCPQGDVWGAKYNRIQQGRGCPHCAGKAPKTEADYHKIGVPRGIHWIGDKLPTNVNAKTSWQCSHGHTWDAPQSSIRKGTGCPDCPRNTTKTETDYRKAGLSRDIRWIGDELPKNTQTKTSWQCPQGDIWDTPYSEIRRGRGCPRCYGMVNGVQVSSQQEWLCDLVAGELNTYIDPYYVDITAFIDGVNIAIEYDGWHWHKGSLDKDAKRDADLIAAGWHVLRVKSNSMLPDERLVFDAIMRLLGGSMYEEIVLEDWGE